MQAEERNNAYRQDLTLRLRNCLLNYAPIAELVEDDAAHWDRLWLLCRDVEKGIHRQTFLNCHACGIKAVVENPDFQVSYQATAFSLLANLDCASSVGSSYLAHRCYARLLVAAWLVHFPLLARRLCDALLDGELLAGLPPEQLNPQADREYREEYKRRLEATVRIAEETHFSTEYVCDRCGKNRTRPVVVQDRRIDEAPSLVVTCLSCGHRMRMGN